MKICKIQNYLLRWIQAAQDYILLSFLDSYKETICSNLKPILYPWVPVWNETRVIGFTLIFYYINQLWIIYYRIGTKYTPQGDTKWYLKKYMAVILFLLIKTKIWIFLNTKTFLVSQCTLSRNQMFFLSIPKLFTRMYPEPGLTVFYNWTREKETL